MLPLLKKGKDPLSTNSYCGITITSVLGKTFEHILLSKKHPTLPQSQLQYGFTEGRSPNMAALLCTEAVAEGLDNKLPI